MRAIACTSTLSINEEVIVLDSTIGEGVSFAFRETATLHIENSTITHIDENLFALNWTVEGQTLQFNTRMEHNGNLVLVFEREVIPEPSTATLSLLALAGLLMRRRRAPIS